jgi:hypothetical protein
VQIKDVLFFNETLKDVEMGESLLFLFEKEIAVNAESLCIARKKRKNYLSK